MDYKQAEFKINSIKKFVERLDEKGIAVDTDMLTLSTVDTIDAIPETLWELSPYDLSSAFNLALDPKRQKMFFPKNLFNI